jgi:hypothetical protein
VPLLGVGVDPRFRGDDSDSGGTGSYRDPFIIRANARTGSRVRAMPEDRIRENPDQSRQAVKGHGVRYVLAFGLGGAIIALIIVYLAFFA